MMPAQELAFASPIQIDFSLAPVLESKAVIFKTLESAPLLISFDSFLIDAPAHLVAAVAASDLGVPFEVLYALRDDPANMLTAFFERLRLKLESLPVDDFALISFKAGSGLKPCLAMPSVMSKFRSIQDQLKTAAAEKASQELHDLLKDVSPTERAALKGKGKRVAPPKAQARVVKPKSTSVLSPPSLSKNPVQSVLTSPVSCAIPRPSPAVLESGDILAEEQDTSAHASKLEVAIVCLYIFWHVIFQLLYSTFPIIHYEILRIYIYSCIYLCAILLASRVRQGYVFLSCEDAISSRVSLCGNLSLVLFQDIDLDVAPAVDQLVVPSCPEVACEAKDQLFQRKMRFEFDLQDGVLLKASVIVARMKDLSAIARRAGALPYSDYWEARILEIESIVETSGKKEAVAFARAFYAGKSGFSSAQLIELNKRARLCYKASKKGKRSSSSSSVSTSNSDRVQKRRSRSCRPTSTVRAVAKPSKSYCFKCGDPSHIAPACPEGKMRSRNPAQRTGGSFHAFKSRRCLICDDKGHLAARCPLNPANVKKEK